MYIAIVIYYLATGWVVVEFNPPQTADSLMACAEQQAEIRAEADRYIPQMEQRHGPLYDVGVKCQAQGQPA